MRVLCYDCHEVVESDSASPPLAAREHLGPGGTRCPGSGGIHPHTNQEPRKIEIVEPLPELPASPRRRK